VKYLRVTVTAGKKQPCLCIAIALSAGFGIAHLKGVREMDLLGKICKQSIVPARKGLPADCLKQTNSGRELATIYDATWLSTAGDVPTFAQFPLNCVWVIISL
jgi:hypothetical protein